MSLEEIKAIASELASEYPSADKAGTTQDFQSVLETVLPLLTPKVSSVLDEGVENLNQVWQLIREDSQGLFEDALGKTDRLKVIFVTSKFLNNKLIGEKVTGQALEMAKHKKEGRDARGVL